MQAFEVQPLAVETAHTSLPLQCDEAGSGEQGPRKKRARQAGGTLRTVPHMLRVLGEVQALGAGLVADVRLKHDAGL